MINNTILVVDDEHFFRRLYADLLEASGYRVETVVSGEEALRRLHGGGVDLLLTDLVMPGMSGLDLLRQARMIENPPEVIVITGHATLDTAIQALKSGARDYLIKPFQPEQLRHIVHTCLEQRRLLGENAHLKSQIRLFQEGQHLASLLEIDQLLPRALDLLLQETGEGRGFAFLVGASGQIQRFPALTGLQEVEAAALAETFLPFFTLSPTSRALQGEELPSIGTDSIELHSAWIFPFHNQNDLKGGIVLVNEAGKATSFPNDSLLFLAEQAALGFHNACIYQGTCALIHIDDLTGLHNYRYLQMILSREVRRTERYGLSFGLIFIDLDRFKLVNDNYGHLAGSAALREVGEVLRKSVREVDLLFRYGGDEFTALLVETDVRGSAAVAERIRQAIEQHTFLTNQNLEVRLTATVGYACYPEDTRCKEEIIDIADRAMYQGKQFRNVSRGAKDLEEARKTDGGLK
jgi:two-component system, cell cycle response regulator